MPVTIQNKGKLIVHLFTKDDAAPAVSASVLGPLGLGVIVGGPRDGELVIGFADQESCFISLETGAYTWIGHSYQVRKLRSSEAVTLIVK